jgi:hypothetical protein
MSTDLVSEAIREIREGVLRGNFVELEDLHAQALVDEIERLRKYAQHLPTCPTVASTDGPNAPYPCRCGLEGT